MILKSPKERLCVALDVDSYDEAKKIVNELKNHAGMFKVNSLFLSEGPNIIELVKSMGCKIFLDLKFHDIPNTVSNYARQAVRMGADVFTVHASGGFEMMKAARDAAEDEAKKLDVDRPMILGITVLTSIDEKALNNDLLVDGAVEDQVGHLAKLALKAGLDGVVASPRETRMIRDECGKDFVIVTPGIRPMEEDKNKEKKKDDQKRTMTPREAIKEGADFIVVGRPILEAKNRADAAKKIISELSD